MASLFSERLWASPGLYLAGGLLLPGVTLMIAPISLPIAIVIAIGVYAGFLGFLAATAPRVQVTESELRAGRASIGREHIGSVTVNSTERTRELLSTSADARAFLVIRSWIKRSVTVELVDPNDPTPYWLISSRRPELLLEALSAPRSD